MQSPRQADEDLRALASRGVRVAAGRGEPLQRFVTGCALLCAPAVLVGIAPGNPAVWWTFPVALLVIDLLSGVVHWVFDNCVSPGPSLPGRIAVNFLDHHVHPLRSVEVGFSATTWRVAVYLSLPLMLLAWLLPAGPAQAWVFWLGALSLVVAQTHKEAHKRHPAAWVRWLQRARLSLPPEHHRRHHRNHDQAYCVFTGWWNPLLDRIGFWRGLDKVSSAVGATTRSRFRRG